jgi:hypothetical protein
MTDWRSESGGKGIVEKGRKGSKGSYSNTSVTKKKRFPFDFAVCLTVLESQLM